MRALETDVAALKRSPERTKELLAATDCLVRAALADLRNTLLERPGGAREVFEAVFPDGLIMEPAEHGGRKVWAIRDHSTLSNDTSTPKTDTTSPGDAPEVSDVSASAAAKESNLEGEASGGRRVWAIRGMAQLDLSTLSCDPTVAFLKMDRTYHETWLAEPT